MTTVDLNPPLSLPDEDVAVALWACDNCTAENSPTRKRCEECGTSRD